MESCHVLRLPDEIHVAVAELLPGNAIKSLRATCTKLNTIASPYLFPVLYLSCHQLDLDVFRLVTSNPLLISGVKELVIDDTTLSPRLADWEVYRTMASYSHMWPERKNAYHWPQKFDEAGRIWSDEPDKEFHNLFTSVLKGHHENRQSHADIIALKQAMPLFKSLRSLVISNRTADDDFDSGAQSEESSSPVVKMWRRFGATKQERPPFPPRCDWIAPWHEPGSRAEVMQLDFFNDDLEKYIKEYGVPPTADEQEKRDTADAQSATEDLASHNGFLDGYHCRMVGREARAVIIALEVLGDPSIRTRLTEFRVDASLEVGDTSLYQPGLPILLFDSHESPFPPKLISSFSSNCMTKFHLVLSDYRDAFDGAFIGGKSMDQGNIAQLLASMPQLEDLLLEPHGMKVFSAIPDDVTFRRLQRVEFSCGEIDPQKLVGFIRRHASTLKFLTVQYCCIDPDNYEDIWEDVMRDIRHMQDAKALDLYDGQVTGAYVDAPSEGCGKNNTLDLGGPEMVRHWEFMFFSFWRRYHEYRWEFQSDDEEGGASDLESGSEGSENEASGL
ncbi:uncharacterized protein FSUBG_46 [Fusarium subglutinans]|uniref:F-box domain-containing protein n=1 Tax=Gibberella subglutinans TaxID=42677 RepID=A0A8H5QI07_GIBSU|nr:uncharacterized protein FSUBG_46 [Fusarium subglutinans]KAF5614166.1 hypothetical protein FSUBG_46 [Fusarium subglutinans]